MPVNRKQPIECPAPGVYRDMPEEKYHKLNAVNASLLKDCATPLEMLYWLETEPDAATYSMFFGSALHAALLRPLHYDANKCVVAGLRPQAIAKTFAKAAIDNPGKIILAEDEWEERIDKIRRRCAFSPDVNAALNAEKRILCETVVIADDNPGTGLRMRCMVDLLTEVAGQARLYDVKSTSAENPREFLREIWSRGYDIQLAMYRRVLRNAGVRDKTTNLPIRGGWIVCQTKAPYDVYLLDCDEHWEQLGDARLNERITKFAHALANEKWPGHGGGSGTIVVPPEKWMLSQYFQGDE